MYNKWIIIVFIQTFNFSILFLIGMCIKRTLNKYVMPKICVCL